MRDSKLSRKMIHRKQTFIVQEVGLIQKIVWKNKLTVELSQAL